MSLNYEALTSGNSGIICKYHIKALTWACKALKKVFSVCRNFIQRQSDSICLCQINCTRENEHCFRFLSYVYITHRPLYCWDSLQHLVWISLSHFNHSPPGTGRAGISLLLPCSSSTVPTDSPSRKEEKHHGSNHEPAGCDRTNSLSCSRLIVELYTFNTVTRKRPDQR